MVSPRTLADTDDKGSFRHPNPPSCQALLYMLAGAAASRKRGESEMFEQPVQNGGLRMRLESVGIDVNPLWASGLDHRPESGRGDGAGEGNEHLPSFFIQ